MKSYPKDSDLIMSMLVEDINVAERSIIDSFDSKFIKRKDIGNEYYEGNINIIRKFFFEILNTIINEPTNKANTSKEVKSIDSVKNFWYQYLNKDDAFFGLLVIKKEVYNEFKILDSSVSDIRFWKDTKKFKEFKVVQRKGQRMILIPTKEELKFILSSYFEKGPVIESNLPLTLSSVATDIPKPVIDFFDHINPVKEIVGPDRLIDYFGLDTHVYNPTGWGYDNKFNLF